MGFIDTGWTLNNGVITIPDGADKWAAYRFILEAIYDGHVPVTRIVGYHISTATTIKKSRDKRIFERDTDCADDRLTIASNLSEILVPVCPHTQISTDTLSGVITVDKFKAIFSGKEVPVLSSKEYILTALSGINLSLVLNESTGYRSADYNYDKIIQQRNGKVSKTRFFPIYSYHCLVKFIRVLPWDGSSSIKLKYMHGMSDIVLMHLLEKMYVSPESKDWVDEKMKEVTA